MRQTRNGVTEHMDGWRRKWRMQIPILDSRYVKWRIANDR
jgi:hypothetical protein